MKLRRALLVAGLTVGMVPAALLALLAFDRASAALQAEIERGLVAQADAVQSELDRLMIERLQNAATWRRLEVVQDIQVGDVDKRLAAFLQRLVQGYGGIYLELAAVDPQGRVVASSDAMRIKHTAATSTPWRTVQLDDSTITLGLPQPGERGALLMLRTPVASAFGGGALGELQLQVDWGGIDRRLDEAAAGARSLALVDGQGRLLAASARLRDSLPRLGLEMAALAAAPVLANVPAVLAGEKPFVGIGRSRAMAGLAGFSGFGWTVLVLEPREQALAPVRAMALIFAALLAGVAVLAALAAGALSQRIARPIVALTTFSRSYRQGQLPAEPPAAAGRELAEVTELRQAFGQMVQDIARSQQQLAQATALAAVGEMSAVIAHEVRTPLGVVLSSAQILQREPRLSDEGRELLSYIESETERLARLVSTMLEGARPRAPQFERTDLVELVGHAAGLLAAQAAKQGVQVTPPVAGPPLHCEVDAEQITQVLLNLILNGLQILQRGGRMVLALHEARDDANDDAVIEIADDGPGIAPEARSRIFEAFFFQREGGIGLGLAVVQRIVVAHGGRIEASESELGGALFRLHLPRRQKN